LGNVIADNIKARDYFLSTEFPNLLANYIVSKTDSLNFIQLSCWLVANLCKGIPIPDLDKVKIFISPLSKLLETANDKRLLSEALWVVANIADSDEGAKEVLTSIGVLPITKFILSKDIELEIPALKVLGNYCSGDSANVDAVLSEGGLTALFSVLTTTNEIPVIRDICWVVSNIASGPEKHIEAIISSGCLDALIYLLRKDYNVDTKAEAMHVISNLCKYGSREQLHKIGKEELTEALVCNLDTTDCEMLLLILDSLEELLQNDSEREENSFMSKLILVDGKEKLEKLLGHTNTTIYQKVFRILEHFFEGNNFEDEEAMGN